MILFKGNLAHKFTDLYFWCFSTHLDIVKALKTKTIVNNGATGGNTSNRKSLNQGFPNDSLCDVITLGNSLLREIEFLSW